MSKKLSINTPDYYALNSIIPEHLSGNDRFLEFIETYLEWQQNTTVSPSKILNELEESRNIDLVADDFLGYLQREFAAPIPNISNVDRRKLYKQVNDIYRAKGSIPSYEALFNLIFQDEIELYFPRVDMLKPSDGKWDNVSKRYLDQNGFCSDRKKLQDSYYYQDYSYVIKTGQTYEKWKDIVTKILHPAGFIFFGQIKIISIANKQSLKTPGIQPGQLAAEPPFLPIILDKVVVTPKVVQRTTSVSRVAHLPINKFGPTYLHLEQIKFLLREQNVKYADLTFEIIETPGGGKTHILPNLTGSFGNIGEGYSDTTLVLSEFLSTAPADLSENPSLEIINLEEPTDITVTVSLD
jgi:hypothetical protein